MKKELNEGFSLIEMLVVLVVFSVLIVLSTQAVFLTLRSAKKAENLVEVRQNLDNAVGVIERGLRNAADIDCTAQALGNESVEFEDSDGNTVAYSCNNIGDPVSSTLEEDITGPNARSGNLTSDEILMTQCVFLCDQNAASDAPPKVTIDLEAQSKGSSGTEAATVSVRTQVYIRIYDY